VKLTEIAERLNLVNLTPETDPWRFTDMKAGHACDLLSDVLANAPAGGILVTIQVHLNVIAVCVHAGVSAVIFAAGMVPDDAVRQKAVEEGLVLYSTREPTFDIVGKLYFLGLRGTHA
jgi:hypothetical protein